MIGKVKALYLKHEEIVNYLIVGVLNTIVSWAAWFICAYTILDAQVVWQNAALSVISCAPGALGAIKRGWRLVSVSVP